MSPSAGDLAVRLLLFGKHLLSSGNALAQAVLEVRVSLSLGNVLRDRSSDHLRDWLIIHSSHSLQLLSLLF